MQITSSAFSGGTSIPRRFTCDGDDLSPPLAWREAPADARSFVLLCDDPDAPSGTYHHWAAYDIAPTETALAEGAAGGGKPGFRQAINDFGDEGYGGPCPPPGHGEHRYHFRLLALDVAHLRVPDPANCVDVEREARRHVLAEAVLIGTYGR